MALDLYTRLTYRMSYLEKPTAIPWTALARQLGADDADPREFARSARRFLKRIELLYPALRLGDEKGRLILHPAPSHIRRQLAGA